MQVRSNIVRISQLPCAGTKIQHFSEYKKYYIFVSKILRLLLCTYTKTTSKVRQTNNYGKRQLNRWVESESKI